MVLQPTDPVTILLAAGAVLALVIIITLGIKIAGCIFTMLLIFLPAAIAGEPADTSTTNRPASPPPSSSPS